MTEIINWLEKNMMACFYKKYMGISCPGCGMQRAFIELMKGNIYESFTHYPALMPLIIMFVYLFLFVIFRFKNGVDILKYMFFVNVGIIIINFVYNQFN